MTRSLRIAIVSNYFAPHMGGAANQNRLIGEALVRRGHHVTILTRRFESRLSTKEWIGGMAVKRFSPTGRSMAGKWLLNFSTAWNLIRTRYAFDIVFVTQISPHAIGPAIVNRLRGIPIVLRPIEHDELTGEISREMLAKTVVAKSLIRFMLNTARQWAYRQATRVIVTSRAIEQEAQNFGFPASSLARIPNAIDMTRFLPANDEERAKLRKQLSLPEGEAIVVWVGRLVLRKGLETMIEAWSELVRHRPRTLLLIVGAGSGAGHIHDAEENLRAAVVERKLEACVKLVGAVQDVERYLRASDLFAFTSEAEGFGVALVEAMACGLPVITSRIEGAAADLVDDGKEGLKYDVGNAFQLHQCLTTMLANPELRRQMGNAGHARVKSTLDVESVANSYELLFKSVLADSKN